MTSMTVSIEKLATNMEYMAKEQTKQGKQLDLQDEKLDRQDEKIEELKLKPAKKWDALIAGIIGAIAAAIGTAIMAGIIH